MLFEGMNPIITDQDTVIKVVKEVEIPVFLNLALCYNKMHEYHYAIRYCTEALARNDRHDKAYYRRGMAYIGIGELNKAKQDLTMALELT
jgi:tetratricopeptide (TPR) repeat protein